MNVHFMQDGRYRRIRWGIIIIFVSIGFLLWGTQTSFAQTGETGDVCGDNRGFGSCSAGDFSADIISVAVAPGNGCDFEGDTASLLLELRMESTAASSRFDIGYYVALDGGSAESGDMCFHGIIDSTNSAFQQLDPGAADACGDISNSAIDVQLTALEIICKDDDNDGFLDPINICHSYKTVGQDTTCNDPSAATAEPGSKCGCADIELPEDIPIPLAKGKLEVVKVLNPAEDLGNFNLWIDNELLAGDVGDGGTTGEQEVISGTHVISETAGTDTTVGNYNTHISCVDQGGPGVTIAETFGTGPLNVSVKTDEDILCTITNERIQSRVTFEKAVIGGSAEPTDWTFDIVNGQQNIAHDETITINTGTYTVTEDGPDTYVLTNASGLCALVDGMIQLHADDDGGTCTITNTFQASQRGTINIIKDADPDDSTDFHFIGDLDNFVLDDDSDPTLPNMRSFTVDVGSYTVKEESVEGWKLANIACQDEGNQPIVGLDVDIANGTVTIPLVAEKTVTCTFENRRLGTIQIVKKAMPDNTGQKFDFTGNGGLGNFSLGHNETKSFSNVMPGFYQVGESVPAGWKLETIFCVDPDNGTTTNLDSATATLDLDFGETIICTFANMMPDPEKGMLIVQKLTEPIDTETNFPFIGSESLGNFSLKHGGVALFDVTAGQSISLSEEVPAGWQLASATCNNGNSVEDIQLDANQTVICTFINKQERPTPVPPTPTPVPPTPTATPVPPIGPEPISPTPALPTATLIPPTATVTQIPPLPTEMPTGKIIIKKQTDLNGSQGPFQFMASQPLLGIFWLFNGETTVFDNVKPGTYQIMEAAREDWALTDISCIDPDMGTFTNVREGVASIDLDAGETVHCLFSNTKARTGSIIIKKSTFSNISAPFDFEIDGGQFDQDIFWLYAGKEQNFEDIVPGTYTVNEIVRPDGWQLIDISCNDQDKGTTVDLANGKAIIDLDADELVVCVFTNDKVAPPTSTSVPTSTPIPTSISVPTSTSVSTEAPVPTSTATPFTPTVTPEPTTAVPTATATLAPSPTPLPPKTAPVILENVEIIPVPAPGDEVQCTIQVKNPGDQPLTITGIETMLESVKYTELPLGTVPTSCTVPQSLAPGEVYTCTTTFIFNGEGGDVAMCKAIVDAKDKFGQQCSVEDIANTYKIQSPSALDEENEPVMTQQLFLPTILR